MTIDGAGLPHNPPILLSIGHIQVTDQYVMTPSGTWPLAEVNVTTIDQTRITTYTPGWAIAMVVIFIWFFLLSLLFLLAKESRMGGFVSVHIQSGNYTYTEQMPVSNDFQRIDVFNRVHFLQTQIGRARSVR
ncbi:hypothetical protein SAMN04489740_3003 [Arthrobacter alpinus]|uniref:Uncharacterized protein n=1 Tax=Arthrobacter alpinus TaxID=656366 RepID=A0A1H5MKX6_9MICC|nr:hypothetical protein [Arthrobacter alpinus]SEE89974.1 hypothetical protein SAMN04489740_3003 [Arthrobacter alpinus]